MVPTLCVSQSFLIEELPVPNFLSSLMGGGYKPGGFDRGKQRCPSASCGQRAMQSCVLGNQAFSTTAVVTLRESRLVLVQKTAG